MLGVEGLGMRPVYLYIRTAFLNSTTPSAGQLSGGYAGMKQSVITLVISNIHPRSMSWGGYIHFVF